MSTYLDRIIESRLLSWLVYLLVLPIEILVFSTLLLYKCFLMIYIKIYSSHYQFIEPLSSYDKIFAIDDFYVKPLAANATIIVLDKPIDLGELKARFVSHVLPKFNKLDKIPAPLGGHYFWKRVPLDLNLQIRQVSLPTSDVNNNLPVNGQFQSYMNELSSAPFPVHGGPLWEAILVNRNILVLRMHHVLGDGYTFNHWVDALLGVTSPYMVKDCETKGVWQWLQFMSRFPQLTFKLFYDALLKEKDVFTQKKLKTETCFSMTEFDLNTLKEVRRALGVHFATLGMSLLGGALTRGMKEKAGNDFSLMHSLPRPNHPFTMCNHW